MADSELRKDPFDRLGTHVFGKRFVGRGSVARLLHEYCTSRNYSIVGLPKVGKTSLAYDSIIYQHDKIVNCEPNHPLCVMMFAAGNCVDAKDFFKELVIEVYQELQKIVPESNVKDRDILEKSYMAVEAKGFASDGVKRFFEKGINAMAVQLVVVIDEFDSVRDFFHSDDFRRLRIILCVPNVHAVITSKRTIFDIENWKKDAISGSTFYQLFTGNTLYLTPFEHQDLEGYWERLQPYYEVICFPDDENYRKVALYYAGTHPHKLDLFNNANYISFKENGSLMSDEDIRSKMKEAFDAEFHVLDTVDLLDAAVQAIIGPVNDLAGIQDERVIKLKQYGFLRAISEDEKRQILGADNSGLSFMVGDEHMAYVAPSDYCTVYMKEISSRLVQRTHLGNNNRDLSNGNTSSSFLGSNPNL